MHVCLHTNVFLCMSTVLMCTENRIDKMMVIAGTLLTTTTTLLTD